MAKQTHRVRVWARRNGRRHLEYSRDAQRAREGALMVVETLQGQPDVDAIDMEEYVVLPDTDGEAGPTARRGTVRWVRGSDRWREVSG